MATQMEQAMASAPEQEPRAAETKAEIVVGPQLEKFYNKAIDAEMKTLERYLNEVNEQNKLMSEYLRASKDKSEAGQERASELKEEYEKAKAKVKRRENTFSDGLAQLAGELSTSNKKDRAQVRNMLADGTLRKDLIDLANQDPEYKSKLIEQARNDYQKKQERQAKRAADMEQLEVENLMEQIKKGISDEELALHTTWMYLQEEKGMTPEEAAAELPNYHKIAKKDLDRMMRDWEHGGAATSATEESVIQHLVEDGVSYDDDMVESIQEMVNSHTREQLIKKIDEEFPAVFKKNEDGVIRPIEGIRGDEEFEVLYAAYQIKDRQALENQLSAEERHEVTGGPKEKKKGFWSKLFGRN